MDWFKEQYLSRLKELGFANVNGRVRKKELLESFLDFYDHGLLEKMQSDINNNNNWLNDVLRRNNRTTHPLRHLYLCSSSEFPFQIFLLKKSNINRLERNLGLV
ncbi:hypothetical protein HUN92_22135 [Bacillus firmus]|nr:hypothetical protein [Cytobacillus firmus]